jgi:hypothetical protein
MEIDGQGEKPRNIREGIDRMLTPLDRKERD